MSGRKLVKAQRVRALDGYRLDIEFTDGSSGVIDLSEFVSWGEVTAPLRDPAYFAKVFVEQGEPTWPNGCNYDAINAHRQLAAAGELRSSAEAA